MALLDAKKISSSVKIFVPRTFLVGTSLF